jgi:hypothetical protein
VHDGVWRNGAQAGRLVTADPAVGRLLQESGREEHSRRVGAELGRRSATQLGLLDKQARALGRQLATETFELLERGPGVVRQLRQLGGRFVVDEPCIIGKLCHLMPLH